MAGPWILESVFHPQVRTAVGWLSESAGIAQPGVRYGIATAVEASVFAHPAYGHCDPHWRCAVLPGHLAAPFQPTPGPAWCDEFHRRIHGRAGGSFYRLEPVCVAGSASSWLCLRPSLAAPDHPERAGFGLAGQRQSACVAHQQ
ncbi:hypothetical protein D3C80_1704570 [compost metagenome]